MSSNSLFIVDSELHRASSVYLCHFGKIEKKTGLLSLLMPSFLKTTLSTSRPAKAVDSNHSLVFYGKEVV